MSASQQGPVATTAVVVDPRAADTLGAQLRAGQRQVKDAELATYKTLLHQLVEQVRRELTLHWSTIWERLMQPTGVFEVTVGPVDYIGQGKFHIPERQQELEAELKRVVGYPVKTKIYQDAVLVLMHAMDGEVFEPSMTAQATHLRAPPSGMTFAPPPPGAGGHPAGPPAQVPSPYQGPPAAYAYGGTSMPPGFAPHAPGAPVAPLPPPDALDPYGRPRGVA
jgi:hypothetical protein